ncbi:MAG: DUF4150 domain-containing protein [Fuerstiella sp.]
MLPASTNAAGTCNNSAPDVCNTPSPAGPVPVPYPNIAQCAMAINTAVNVMFTKRPVIHKMSEIPLSSGDEAGTAGGVKSGVFIQKATFTMGASKVMVEGQAVVYQSANTAHNGASFNIPGVQSAPSQTNVMVNP